MALSSRAQGSLDGVDNDCDGSEIFRTSHCQKGVVSLTVDFDCLWEEFQTDSLKVFLYIYQGNEWILSQGETLTSEKPSVELKYFTDGSYIEVCTIEIGEVKKSPILRVSL